MSSLPEIWLERLLRIPGWPVADVARWIHYIMFYGVMFAIAVLHNLSTPVIAGLLFFTCFLLAQHIALGACMLSGIDMRVGQRSCGVVGPILRLFGFSEDEKSQLAVTKLLAAGCIYVFIVELVWRLAL
jgi:hypothetical protein